MYKEYSVVFGVSNTSVLTNYVILGNSISRALSSESGKVGGKICLPHSMWNVKEDTHEAVSTEHGIVGTL